MGSVFPSYEELPEEVPGYRCSWAYFNSLPSNLNEKDQLGTLNFLTPTRKRKAVQEVKTGRSFSLDLPLNFFAHDISAFGGRAAPVQTIKQIAPFAHEDSLNYNTQSASQWDGFRHFGIRSTGQYYNGYKSEDFSSSDVIGINAWLKTGGILGRGILIDFLSWATYRGEKINPNAGRSITLSEVLEILAFQKTNILPGDILIFRTGWLAWYINTDKIERHTELCVRNAPGKHSFIGLAQERGLVSWLWDNQIAAVAGDQVAFECTPPPENGFGWLHEHLLGALGCPIGELWNTEELALVCKETGRYSFLLTSAPMNVNGGVASTSNALATV